MNINAGSVSFLIAMSFSKAAAKHKSKPIDIWGVPVTISDGIMLAGLFEKAETCIASGKMTQAPATTRPNKNMTIRDCIALEARISLYVAVVERNVLLRIEWNQSNVNVNTGDCEPFYMIKASFALQEDGTFRLHLPPDASRLNSNGVMQPYSIGNGRLEAWEANLNECFKGSRPLRNAYKMASGVRLILRE